MINNDSKEFLHYILGRLTGAVQNILHPALYQRTLREIGVGLGREVVDQMRRSRTVQQSATQEDFLRCLAGLKTSLKWSHSAEVEAKNRIRVHISHCPFGKLAAEDPHLCQLEAGLLGGIAGDLFGYGKVAIQQGPDLPPKDCCLTIHLERTPESLAIEGPTYPLGHSTKKGARPISTEARGFDQLTPRERQIVRLVGEGLSDKEIATALSLSVRTAEGHIARIREKTGLGSRSALIRWAIRINHEG